jgi:pSer/pThr/pTyr-binding forkhead associated (FHA) protein
MPLSMKLEMTVLSCELVGEPGNAQSSLAAVCGIPELRRCRSGPSPASKRPSDLQQENGPREDVRTDGQYGPYGQEDILPDDMTGTTARTEAAFPDEQNDRTEKIGEVPKPVLLFRLRDRSCLCFRLRVIRLGRSRKRCDVCLEDNAKISGYHADLQLKNGSVYLRDVGSTNGTFLNGVRLKEDVPEKLPEHAFFRLFDESFQVVYGPDAERICSDGFVLMLQNAVTLEKRYVTEPELLLDRKHPWEGGTLNDILISREHAKIVFVGKQPCVIDLLSHNGTWLDGRKLESGQPTALLDGMRLRLGDTELICSLVEVSESGDPEPAQSGAGTPD